MYDVSIIIPTYNRCSLLEMTLKSIANQDLKNISMEVLVIDDGSVDNTPKLTEEYKQVISNLKYFYNKHDRYRVAYVRNIGIRNANGKIIIFVDTGMVLCKDYVFQHYRSHAENENAAVIGSIYGYTVSLEDKAFSKIIDLTDIDKTFSCVEAKTEYMDVRMESFRYHSYNISNLMAPYTFFWTGNVSVQRRLILEIGGFDEKFIGWGVEDIDFGYRLFLNGAKYILNLRAKSIHIPHELPVDVKDVLDKDRGIDNKIYFHMKYKNIDSELFVTGCQDLFYNRDLYTIYINSINRFDFRCIKGTGIIEEPLNETTIIYGAGDGSILRFCEGPTVLEYEKSKYIFLKDNFQYNKVYNSIGTMTFFTDKQYNVCLITDYWIYLNDYLLLNLIKESLRISDTVLILFQISIGGTDCIQKIDLSKVTNCLDSLAIKYIPYEFTEYRNTFYYLKFSEMQ